MKRIIRANILVLLDIVIVNLSVLLAYYLKFEGQIGDITPEFLDKIVFLLTMSTIIKIICFAAFKLYSSLWKYAGAYELVTVFAAAFIANSIMFAYVIVDFELSGSLLAPRSIFAIAFLIDIFLIGSSRFAYRGLRRFLHGEVIRFNNSKRIMIIGGGDAGAVVVKELKYNFRLKCHPVAIIDDNAMKHGKKLNGVHIVGGRDKIAQTVHKKQIDEIIIAIPTAKTKDINEIYAECSKTECKIKILPSVSQLIDESVVMQRIREVNIEDLLGRDPVKLNCLEIASYIDDRIVMVTGGGGSIGSELCRQIAYFKPKQLIILDNYENNLYDIHNELAYKYPALSIEAIIANVREKHRVDTVFRIYRPHVVFHAAAHKHVPLMEHNPTEAIKNNVFGSLNVAQAADKYNAKRFVLISTDKAVNPTNIMGATKRLAEMAIQGLNRHSSTEFVAVRFGNVLGSNGSVIPLFKRQIENGGPVTVTHKEVIRYFMTIPEAVQLVLQAGGMADGGEIFVLDMGEPVKIYDLAKNLIKLSGFEPEQDIKIEITGLRPGEKLYEELLMDDEGLQSTGNNKIFIAKPLFKDLDELLSEINTLKEKVIINSADAVEYIRDIVPTYQKAENGVPGKDIANLV